MAEGQRDAFIENDVIGNYNMGTSFLGSSPSRKHRKKTKKRRRKVKHSRRKHRKRRAIRNHKRRSRSKIKYTKKGQPYRIMPNGRARFIKK